MDNYMAGNICALILRLLIMYHKLATTIQHLCDLFR